MVFLPNPILMLAIKGDLVYLCMPSIAKLNFPLSNEHLKTTTENIK